MSISRCIAIGTLAVAAAACSSSSDDASTTTTIDNVGTTTTSAEASATTTTTAAPAGDPVVHDADPITQLTPTTGEGIRPLLEWESVPSAAIYTVIVYDAVGAPYWSAVTAEPQVFVGGRLQIPEGRTGPNIGDGYTWAVYADAADGTFLAASPLRDIAP